ncbi:MAG: uracil-DNA glycosylase [Gammaproteobacteria bacterium]|jgi:uracil-DNA glycosylase family 4|nr:MAG: uracil-DNA glycosylase [Gammaproteobacteria bacterium]
MGKLTQFDPACKRCPRIATHLDQVRIKFPGYHARPVPPFGVENPKLLIVGLGPGLHGANATARPFTGDHAGILLYRTLFEFGFSNQPVANDRNDGLQLIDCRITNAVKCLPPGNKPTPLEIRTCNSFLNAELTEYPRGQVILALGRVAHEAILKALAHKQSDFPFSHGANHKIQSDRWLVDSFHCSRYNTQTRRLTETMFHDVFYKIHELLASIN